MQATSRTQGQLQPRREDGRMTYEDYYNVIKDMEDKGIISIPMAHVLNDLLIAHSKAPRPLTDTLPTVQPTAL